MHTLRTLQSFPGNKLGVGREGAGAPDQPPGPYLLGHSGLHHTRGVGLQTVAVAAIGVQLQKGPPGGEERATRSAQGRAQSQPP